MECSDWGLGLMSNVSNKVKLAQKELGKSVIAINPNLADEIQGKNRELLYFGIKDTNQIPEAMIRQLRNNPDFAWLTIDKASDKGRAIDTDLINPLTYRIMTGSTSGGPINILKGINDFAIGTDGGGSILAPAMSCQLPSVIGSGTGLFVKNKKLSTDQLEFTGSVGVIAKRVSVLKKVMECLRQIKLASSQRKKIRVVIPKHGSVLTADQIDMHEKVLNHLSSIDCATYDFEEVAMTGIDNRKIGIELINQCFQDNEADMMITCEGPVDVYGYGETIPQHFGEVGRNITRNHGKFLLRAANMCKTTAITVPTSTLASGLVIIARGGIEHCEMAFDLAEKLERSIKLPEVWKRYFLENEQEFSGLTF
ncbi:amidase [Virgibacillus dakarensis]|nr:amidase [Virgibacillus dakarensis]